MFLIKKIIVTEVKPTSESEVYDIIIEARKDKRKIGIRGFGRHTRRELKCDLIISTTNLNNFEIKENKIIAESGADIQKIREEALQKDLLLPTFYDGSIGGLLALNEVSSISTAYGTPWDFTEWIDFITYLGKIRWRIAIGSQGLFGVISKASIKLFERPKKVFIYEREIIDKKEIENQLRKLIHLKPIALLVEYDGNRRSFEIHSSFTTEYALEGYSKDEGVPIISELSDKNSYIVYVNDFIEDFISIANKISPYYMYGIYGVNSIKIYVTDESLLKGLKYHPRHEAHPIFYKIKRILDLYNVFA
ncbi:MAG: FAD-binding oxidoreductase [Saccharolobus sp.]